MLIGGLQKTTLIDFPGRVACTLFTVGCNFRCPFCHNKDLVTLDNFRKSGLQDISGQSFFEFLKKRKRILDGVCITGGEPTINKDLPQFCKQIKDLGLEVKLDTNGSNPEMLGRLINKKLVNFVAMDVKTNFENYSKLVLKIKNQKPACRQARSKIKNKEKNLELVYNIKKSIALILKSGLEYEFRTTVVRGIHDKKNLLKLAEQLKQESEKVDERSVKIEKVNWIWQNFRPQNCLDPQYLGVKPYSSQEIRAILKAVRQIFPKTKLRGVD
jgi:pyruvate formate lyase activating enzyme